MTGSVEASPALSLDVVKARIFYLACDVESVSPPAAMLLRAVADAIEEGTGDVTAVAKPFSVLEEPPKFRELHPGLRSLAAMGRQLGLAGSRSGSRS